MKKLVLVLSVALGMVALSARSYAGEMDILLGKLVDKGILTASEAQEIRTETNDEMAKQEKQQAKQREEDYKKVAKDTLPDWVKNTKLSGDFRNRYQWDKAKSATTPAIERNRDRIRVRLGLETVPIEDFKMGVGIATGVTTNPKSTNVTLGDGFSGKGIMLDYGYAEYSPQWTSPLKTTFTAGKFKNPFWEPVEGFVDGDLKLDGAGILLGYKPDQNLNLFLNYAFLYIGDYYPKSKDPLENVIEPGFDWKVCDNVKMKGMVDFWLSEVKGMTKLTNSPGSNTLARNADQNNTSDIVYQNDYNVVLPKMEIGFTEPFFGFNPGFPYLGVFGEYADNLSPAHDHTGWIGGFRVGNEKIVDKWQWQLVYDHRFLEKDSFLDIYPEDDFYGGTLPSAGNHVSFNLGLSKNSWIALSYYNTRSTTRLTDDSGSSRLGSQTIQADWSVKF